MKNRNVCIRICRVQYPKDTPHLLRIEARGNSTESVYEG